MPGFSYKRKLSSRRRFGFSMRRPFSSFQSRFKRTRTSGYSTWKRRVDGQNMPNISTRPTTRVVKAPTDLIPDRLFVPLKYVLRFSNTSDVALASQQVYLNSAFDCGIASDTTSAYGYSRMMTLYDRCRVWGSKIRVSLSQGSGAVTTAGIPVSMTVFPTTFMNDAPTIGSYQEAMELPFGVTRTRALTNNNISAATAANIQPSPTIIQNRMSVMKLNGLPKASFLGDLNWTSIVNAVPTHDCRWTIFWDSNGVSLVASTLVFFVEVEYLCEFFSRSEFDVGAVADLRAQKGQRIEEFDDGYWADPDDMKDAKEQPQLKRTMSMAIKKPPVAPSGANVKDRNAKEKEKEKDAVGALAKLKINTPTTTSKK